MQDLYKQYGRGPALIQRKRGFGLPVVLASGATAMALAGFFVVAALGRHDAAEPLPPRSTPLEVAKAPTDAVTGSLPGTLLPPIPVEKPAAAPAPAPTAAVSRPAPTPAAAPTPAPAPKPVPVAPLIQAQPPAPPAAAPTVVASAEISTTLPSPIPPLATPVAPPVAASPAPSKSPEAPVTAAPAPKPRTGPSQAEITVLSNRARDLIKSGDIAGARLLLERAASGEDGPSLLALAETFDPAVLDRWGVIGVRPDVEKARGLYQKAADRGVTAAKERMLALR